MNVMRSLSDPIHPNKMGYDRLLPTHFSFDTTHFSIDAPPRKVQELIAGEEQHEQDGVFWDAKEKLPDVGKVTDKYSAWWKGMAKRVHARFFC